MILLNLNTDKPEYSENSMFDTAGEQKSRNVRMQNQKYNRSFVVTTLEWRNLKLSEP